MKTLSVFLLIAALILESTLTTLPLVFLVLLCEIAYFKQNFVFVLAFIFGILLDVVTLRTVGVSSIYFEIFLILVILYKSKLEIKTNSFIIFASFLGSLCFFVVTGLTSNLILKLLISPLIGLVIFVSINKLSQTKKII